MDKTLIGIFIALSGSVIYVLMSICSKQIIDELNVYNLLMLQSCTGFICSFIFLKQKKYHWQDVIGKHNKNYAVRSFISFASIYTLLIALKFVPIFNALVILNTAPLIIPLLRKVFFKKNLHYETILITSIGFLGIVLILSPSQTIFNLSILIVIVSMLCMAFSLIILENMYSYDANLMIFYYFFYSSAILILDQLFHHTFLVTSLWSVGMGVLTGLMFFMVQWSVIQAAKFISSQLITVVFYSEVILSLWFSILFEDVQLTRYLMFGTVLVVTAGIRVIVLEQSATKKK